MKKSFRYTCVGCNGQELEELEYLVGTAKEIQFSTFIQNVDREQIKRFVDEMNYVSLNGQTGLSLGNDYSVNFLSGKTPDNKHAYIMQHSGIEFVFY